jgi:mono/diheme cytochrome c family protein
MKNKRWAVALLGGLAVAIAFVMNGPTQTVSAADAAATYKAKCVACHGANAEKGFNPAKSDAALQNAVLNGVAPKMPAYGSKGISADDAKTLVAYMRQLKK